jgi:hypothetical protein
MTHKTNFLKIYTILLAFAALLGCIILASGQMDWDQTPVNTTCGQIAYSSPVIQKIAVNKDTNSALFFLNWSRNKSDLQLTITSPDGERMPPASNYLQHEKGGWYEFYLFRNPQRGLWSLEIASNNSSEGEDKYCLMVELVENKTQSEDRAEFNDIFTDRGMDRDCDGQIDRIAIRVGLNVRSRGMYSVGGSLCDSDGDSTAQLNGTFLDPGAQSIVLLFPAPDVEGKLTLKNLTLYDADRDILSRMDEAYTTKAYHNIQTNLSLAMLTGDYADRGIDVNGDGFYDLLTIDVGVDVESPGEFTLTGTLFDRSNREVAWSIAHENLSAGYQKMMLGFDGKTIWKHGVSGPYMLKDLVLSSDNWYLNDIERKDYATSAYNFTAFVDPIYPQYLLSGSGSGELLLIFTIREVLPVFSGMYNQDLVGINMPPLSSPWNFNGSKAGYAYDMPGIHLPGKPNDFNVTAQGVKDLNIGLRKSPVKNGINATRTWVTSQINADPAGKAIARTDLISPGTYHVKIFGEAAENASQVNLTLTLVKKLMIKGDFRLLINTTGFPVGNYSEAVGKVYNNLHFFLMLVSD